MLMAASKFEEQMRYLKERGYRVISMRDFLEFTEGKRQLPRKAVVLTFDDGYKSFREFAEPLLKQLGFTATLFVYTDYIGAGPQRALLEGPARAARRPASTSRRTRRRTAISGASRARATPSTRPACGPSWVCPRTLFRQHLGAPGPILAYPYWRLGRRLLKQLDQYGYIAAFTVRRESNSAFITRSQDPGARSTAR